MSGIKHNENEKSEFLRYRSGKMTGEERNAFERKLQRDPFSAEAAEGFDLLTGDEAAADMEILRRNLKTRAGEGGRTRRRSIIAYSGIAAAVVLMVVTSIIFLRPDKASISDYGVAIKEKENTGDSSMNIAMGTPLPETEKIAADNRMTLPPAIAGNIKTPERLEESTGKPVTKKEQSPGVAAEQVSGTAKQEKSGLVSDSLLTQKRSADTRRVSVTGVTDVPDVAVLSERAAEPAFRAKAMEQVIRGVVISGDDSLPIPGVYIAIRGTNLVAISDAEGRFTLDAFADTSRVLIARFIGMDESVTKISSTDMQTITMKQSAMALDEIVVIGYGSNRKSSLEGVLSGVTVSREAEPSEFTAAVPEEGYPAFKEYIKKNIVYPVGTGGSAREVVVLDLPVSREGVKGMPLVVRSPGVAFSEAAFKLVIDGPHWKPSSMNGIPSNDTVRIRLVFKK
jgi:hypothetical protein